MKKIETKIPGVVIIEPDIHGDHRGYFMETYSTSNFHELGIDNVILFKTTCLLQQKKGL